ncbi:hypothetical protein I1A62_00620 (plasmid) [Rhodococcus sp. USK10]|uniref:hypothetical protein n=1 Tax=Rhodococcus sp. USK10 TaxID=2789739 RepID=UPI001C5DAD4D|nr:hypothetical protein [Rhodococcus sp. USK10]QYA99726.1 hypothetical protein I1A62_00620 [Rhodococcus sp. USK10]
MPEVFDWLSQQPNWIWLFAVALVTHRLTLRREKWNREQARRTEQRKAVADFSAAVNGAAPQAGELATWLERRRAARDDAEFDDANNKCDEQMSKFADKIFEIHRAADLLKMSLVDSELNYRASFVLKLAQDISELGGDRRTEPSSKEFSLALLERRCTERMKQLMIATDDLLSAAIYRIPPQTTWLHRKVSIVHFKSKVDELTAFSEKVNADTEAVFKATVGDVQRPTFTNSNGAIEALRIRTGAQRIDTPVEENEAEIIGGPSGKGQVRLTRVAGRDLDRSSIGRYVGRANGGYNQLGKLVDLVPVLTDPRGLWLATIAWGETPTERASTQKVKIPFDTVVEFVELTVDANAGGEM